jgi:hypothetical protein
MGEILVCGRCGASDLPDGTTRDGLPQGWERFIVRGERRYACPACIERHRRRPGSSTMRYRPSPLEANARHEE